MSVKIKKKIHTVLSFWPGFYYFHGYFLALKNVDVYSFWGESGSQKVYGLCTHENVDIYGRPLNMVYNQPLTNKLSFRFQDELRGQPFYTGGEEGLGKFGMLLKNKLQPPFARGRSTMNHSVHVCI